MRNLIPLALLALGCGAENPSNSAPLSADGSTFPAVTQCPEWGAARGMQTLYAFAICDLGNATPRFVTVEACAMRNGAPLRPLRSTSVSTHPTPDRCSPLVLFLPGDLR